MKFFQVFSEKLIRIAGWKTISLSIIVQAAFFFGVFPWFITNFGPGPGMPMLDLRFGFSPAEACAIIGSYSPDGRRGYLVTLLVADFVYPLVYATLLSLIISIVLRNTLSDSVSPWHHLNLLPFAAAVFDWIENAGILVLLIQFPYISGWVAVVASASGMAKWTIISLVVLGVLAGALYPGFLNRKKLRL